MIVLIFFKGLTFSSIGLYLATITMAVTFPLSFLSGDLIPTMGLPKIHLPIVYMNPLTYATAALRHIALEMKSYFQLKQKHIWTNLFSVVHICSNY